MRRWSPGLILVLMLAGVASNAHAGPVIVGLHAGSSIPNLHAGDDNPISTGWSSRVAFAFGLYADYGVSESFSIQPEVNYAPQGGKRNGSQPVYFDISTYYADYDNTADIDYVEIPVLAKYKIGSARQFYATLGPYVGFLLSAKNVTKGTSQIYLDHALTQPLEISPGTPLPPVDFGGTTDLKSDLRSTNWGIQGGLGYGRPLGAGRIELDVRGGYGLVNVQKDTAVNGKNNTGSLVVSLGYGLAPH
ncbi:MAG: porin family protein [Candidatus Eiseniibacteriota bacterium]